MVISFSAPTYGVSCTTQVLYLQHDLISSEHIYCVRKFCLFWIRCQTASAQNSADLRPRVGLEQSNDNILPAMPQLQRQ